MSTSNALEDIASTLRETFVETFVDPMSGFGVLAFVSTLLVCVSYVSVRRMIRGRRVLPGTVLRAIFRRGVLSSASLRLDAAFFFASPFVYALTAKWLIVPYLAIRYGMQSWLTSLFGYRGVSGLSSADLLCIDALVYFFFYELAFWIDHYISHNVPVLWEFHKVHHQAEVLTPMTVTRCHPVDMIKFLNIVALIVSLGLGASDYLLRGSAHSDAFPLPIVMVGSYYLFGHLQHTKLWIPFTGAWGRIFISPAHHQIHHSMSSADFNKNLGLTLSIWDWAFRTLRLPESNREQLKFGVQGSVTAHGAGESLIAPFNRALRIIFRETFRTTGRVQ